MIIFKEATNILELKMAYENIKKIGEYYPNFYDWYWNKVVPGILLKNDKIILGFKNNELIGTSILKLDNNEKKLRALRIEDKFQSKGYGLHLIDESLKILNCDKPLCTVNEHLIHDYSRIFINRYNFDLTYVHKGIYIKNELEYQFNGIKDNIINKTLY